jgi:hypothetical protein
MEEDLLVSTEEFFSDDNLAGPPSNEFFAFKQVGDRVMGELFDKPYEDEDNRFGTQTVYTLKNARGIMDGDAFEKDFINVGLKNTSDKFVIKRANLAEVGDVLGFEFVDAVETDKGNDYKVKKVFVKHRVIKDKFEDGEPFEG